MSPAPARETMKPISNHRIFVLSAILGMTAVLIAAGLNHSTREPASPLHKTRFTHSARDPASPPHKLTADLWVSEQLTPEAPPALKAKGFATIIDLRPDGEVDNQPTAAAVESAARANNMSFFYVPVSHGAIPDEAVTALSKAISSSPKPVLLYCRSGARAARTWSLVEASRPDGLDADAIQTAVKAAGQSADDLNAAIMQRIAHRPQTTGAKP